MRFLVILAALIVAAMSAVLGVATSYYEITVTRKGQDVYKVDGHDIYLKTRYCYEYSYSDDAVLKYEGYGYSKGTLIFTDGIGSSSEECDVEEIYEVLDAPSGAVVLTTSGELEEVEVLLVPTTL